MLKLIWDALPNITGICSVIITILLYIYGRKGKLKLTMPKFGGNFSNGYIDNLENIPIEITNYGGDATMIHLASDTFYTRDQYVRSGGFIKFIFEENSLNRIKNEINIEGQYIDKGDFLLTYRDKINRVYQQTVQYYINIVNSHIDTGTPRYKYYIEFRIMEE